MIFEIENQTTAPQQPGRLLDCLISAVGGLTAAGTALGGGYAAAVRYLSIQDANGNELDRAPVNGTALTGLDMIVQAQLSSSGYLGWVYGLQAWGGTAATPTLGTGTKLAAVALFVPVLKTVEKCVLLQHSAQ